MDEKQIEKAVEISKKIKKLRKHLKEIKHVSLGIELNLSLNNEYYGTPVLLQEYYLGEPFTAFLKKYVKSVSDSIDDLRKELEKL